MSCSRFLAILVAVSVAAPAVATEPRMHVFGPKGCSFAGFGGDGAAYHAIDEQHLLLDFEVMEGVQITCRFDGAFSLIGAPGKIETQTGRCETADGSQRDASFTLSYSDADHATMQISGYEEALPFVACDWP